MSRTPQRPASGLPDKETLLRFLREAGEADKSDLARAFGLKGAERRALQTVVRAGNGSTERGAGQGTCGLGLVRGFTAGEQSDEGQGHKNLFHYKSPNR